MDVWFVGGVVVEVVDGYGEVIGWVEELRVGVARGRRGGGDCGSLCSRVSLSRSQLGAQCVDLLAICAQWHSLELEQKLCS